MSALLEIRERVLRRAKTDTLRLSGVIDQSIVDGPGMRLTVFTQGCPHRCAGCHNPGTHSREGGFDMSVAEVLSRFDANPLLSGITLSGGEPVAQAGALAPLAEAVQRRGKNVWCYTGYTFEKLSAMLPGDRGLAALLRNVDVLVDGRYEESLRNLALSYRGSSNQRVLSMHASLASGVPVFWTKNARFASTRLFAM